MYLIIIKVQKEVLFNVRSRPKAVSIEGGTRKSIFTMRYMTSNRTALGQKVPSF